MPDGSGPATTPSLQSAPLLFEMLRSFTALARHLNLTRAVEELNSTRQTVRRHVANLETLKGGPLFELQDRQYTLTALGHRILPEARDLISRAEGWVSGQSSMVKGLQSLKFISPEGWSLHQQQHPIVRIQNQDSKLLQDVLQAWALSNGQLEHEAMQAVRPHLMVFRQVEGRWLCVEMGEESSYTSWFGWAKARSSIGRDIGGMPGGEGFGHLVNLAYLEVQATHAPRLDHTYTQIPRVDGGPRETLCYERLLTAWRFPDESFAMVSVVRRTHNVELQGVSCELIRRMPEDMVM